MKIQSTHLPKKMLCSFRTSSAQPNSGSSTVVRPFGSSSPNESWSVPRWVSKPRSAIASANNLLQTADKFGWMANPLPTEAQTAISALGAGFAAVNVASELVDGDLEGALWDTGNGIVSLATGAQLLGLPSKGVHGIFAAGAVLNTALAVKQFRAGEKIESYLRMGNVTGLALSVGGGIVGGSVGSVLSSAGLSLRGIVGLTSLARDLRDQNGFLSRPDRFS